jgi:ketosteroid isomerase-like protein
MPEHSPKQVALSFVERINAHDVEGLCALMSEDHAFVDALGRRFDGRESMRHGWTEYFRLFPGYCISCAEVLERKGVVGLFGTASGTRRASGHPALERWEVPAAWKAVVRGGRIAEWRVYCDVGWARGGSGAGERSARG